MEWPPREVLVFEIASAFVVLLALACVLAAVAGEGAARRGAMVALLVGVVATPVVLHGPIPVIAFFSGLFAMVLVMRTIDFLRTPPMPGMGARLIHLLSFADTRRIERVPPHLDVRALVRSVPWAIGAVAMLWIALVVIGPDASGGMRALRWLTGALFAIANLDLVGRVVPVLYAAIGLKIPKIHDSPYLSKSIHEFWGERWNLAVGAWLRDTWHAPLARRGHPILGVFASFAVSGVIHTYLLYLAVGPLWAAVNGAFFVVQPVLLVAERGLGVRAWPAPAARAWTIGAIGLASPLFVEPVLRMLDPLVRGF